MQPVQKSEEIFEIAFGYMGSKALFAGVRLGVFDALAEGPKRFAALLDASGAEERGLRTLLTALVALGLIEQVDGPDGDFRNAPASQVMLVSGPDGGFAEYCRHQVDRQMYPFLHNISDVLQGRRDTVPFKDYETWFGVAEEASLYSESQHAVSLPSAALLNALVDLSNTKRLLDIGGGSGAFSITLCQAHPELSSTIIDFPNVVEVGRRCAARAGLESRIDFICGNALEVEWPTNQQAVLFSYVSGSVSAEGVAEFYRRAYHSLDPGGIVLVHDFIVDDNRRGPLLTALWALQHAAFTPGGVSLTAGFVSGLLSRAGFADLSVEPFVPGMTRLVRGRKPTGESPE